MSIDVIMIYRKTEAGPNRASAGRKPRQIAIGLQAVTEAILAKSPAKIKAEM